MYLPKGCHGGATAEGQIEVLESLGITEFDRRQAVFADLINNEKINMLYRKTWHHESTRFMRLAFDNILVNA